MNFERLLNLAKKYRNFANFDKAIWIDKVGIKNAYKQKNLIHLFNFITDLAFTQKAKGDYSNALKNFLKALTIAQLTSNQEIVKNALLNLALGFIATGKLNSAQKILQYLITQNIPRAFYHLAFIKYLKADFKHSIKLIKQALKFDLSNDIKLKVKLIALLVLNLTELDYLKLAYKYSIKVLILASKNQFFGNLTTYLLNHSQIYLYNKSYQKAETLLKKLIYISKKLQKNKTLIEAYWLLTLTYLAQNKKLAALKSYLIGNIKLKNSGIKDQNLTLFQAMLQLIISCQILKMKMLCLSYLSNFLSLIKLTELNLWLVKLNNFYVYATESEPNSITKVNV